MRSFKKGSGEITPLGVPQKQHENALTGVKQATHATFENVFFVNFIQSLSNYL